MDILNDASFLTSVVPSMGLVPTKLKPMFLSYLSINGDIWDFAGCLIPVAEVLRNLAHGHSGRHKRALLKSGVIKAICEAGLPHQPATSRELILPPFMRP